MAARWYLTKDEMYLQTKYIPTLAATIFTPNAGKKLQKGVRPLPGKKKILDLVIRHRQIASVGRHDSRTQGISCRTKRRQSRCDRA